MTTMSSTTALTITNTKRGKASDVIEFDFKDFQYTPVGKFIIYRLRNNYDAKFLITGDVGEGKTSLGVELARWVRKVANDIFDELYTWDVDKHAGLDVWNYFQAYKNAHPGDALVIDELQEAADRRRANRNENVFLSWAWMKLRVRQVVSIGILPTTSALDKRLMELADVRLHVARRGHAHPYYLFTEPFEPYTTYHFPFRMGVYKQYVRWPNLSGDPDYERLHEMKEETGVPGVDSPDHISESEVKERLRSQKREMVQNLITAVENGGIQTQTRLAQALDLGQPTISKYKREMESEA